MQSVPCIIFMQISAKIIEKYILNYISAKFADNLTNKVQCLDPCFEGQ